MSRPVHIAALDAALRQAVIDERAAAERYAAALDEHIAVIDGVAAIERERVDAYYAIGRCEKAIRQLGYCLLSKPHECRLDIRDEMQAARDRAVPRREGDRSA